MKISILYSSETEHTHQLAKAILDGCIASGEVEASLIRLADQDYTGCRWYNEQILAELDNADAIIFGSPTFMGSLSAKLKAFMEATVSRYFLETWNGKIAAGFTVSGSSGGDKFNTLSALATFAMQHGMIWVGLGTNPFNGNHINSSGHYYGATGRAELDHDPLEMPAKEDLKSGEFLGARVANYVTKLAAK
ncbi:MAG: flavodoxin family protein [Pseudomonadales bacterium]|nr:flavodoxin family protein [Pseudomonadales bacterium]